METVKKFPRRKWIIVALVMMVVSFYFLDIYPKIASLVFVAALLILVAILGFGVNHADVRSRFENWRRRLL